MKGDARACVFVSPGDQLARTGTVSLTEHWHLTGVEFQTHVRSNFFIVANHGKPGPFGVWRHFHEPNLTVNTGPASILLKFLLSLFEALWRNSKVGDRVK